MLAKRYKKLTGTILRRASLQRSVGYGVRTWRVTISIRDTTGFCPYLRDSKDFKDDYDAALAHYKIVTTQMEASV